MSNSLDNIFNAMILLQIDESLSDKRDSIILYISSEQNIFEKNFSLQKKNITEPGEAQIVADVLNLYINFKYEYIDRNKTPNILSSKELKLFRSEYPLLSKSIKQLYDLNNKAVYDKSKTARRTADRVSLIMAVATGVSIILTLTFLLYFPSYLTNPITELTKRIEDISNRKYDQRLEIRSNDEFKYLAEAFNKMAAKLKDYEAQHIDELILEKRRMETLLANLKDGSVLLDNEFRILHSNKKFCDLTNFNVSDLIGKAIYEIPTDNKIIDYLCSFIPDKLNPDLSQHNKKIKLIIDNNTEYFEILLLKLDSNFKSQLHSETSGYIILIQNVTSYEKRDLAKTNFIATISHELKTPLSSINLSIKLLEDNRLGLLTPDQKELINSIKLQSERILRLVNEVLDYSQLETGHIKVNISANDVSDIIELSTFAVMMLINEKEIELDIQLADGLPSVKCDMQKTVWIMVNLLNNAIRYSERRGRVRIKADINKIFVSISVIDFGKGISIEDQSMIFEKYVTSKTQLSKGTGLGLAIAKEFAEVQGGQIGFQSTLGEGSVFYFTLPIV